MVHLGEVVDVSDILDIIRRRRTAVFGFLVVVQDSVHVVLNRGGNGSGGHDRVGVTVVNAAR
jgi:hypothetical protein